MQSGNRNTVGVSGISNSISDLYQWIFSEIKSRLPQVTCLSFMDDLGFIAAGNSIIEIKKILEKAGKITLSWGTRNAVTYDISKTEAMLFFKAKK